MRVRIVILLVSLFLALNVGSANADSNLKIQLKPYNPGESIELVVTVKGDTQAVTTFYLEIHYGGQWWGGGSGPATGENAEQYLVVCYNSCTEWWRGDIPEKGDARITIPLTTSSWDGVFPSGITVVGQVNGQAVSAVLDIKTK